jgi:peptidoglycan/xylan/chitin deacetylase (PgdA/CDA1 family)
MRIPFALSFAVSVSLAALSPSHAQQNAQASPVPQASLGGSAKPAACTNPNALGTARTVEIDTTGGPGFGFEHFKQHDFLRRNEVVFTFDDGPWPGTTPAVLKALDAHCVKATFFPIGKHATWYPEILKQVAEAGHTIGNHTWSHKSLVTKKFDEAKLEIEKGASAVAISAGVPVAPFFRAPVLKHPPEIVTYLGQRNFAIFSTDLDAFDFTARSKERVIENVQKKLAKHGKGIILMHDFQKHTAEALPELLDWLKANGYKVVHMKPKEALTTLAEYDELVRKESKLPTVSARPTSSVVRTVE